MSIGGGGEAIPQSVNFSSWDALNEGIQELEASLSLAGTIRRSAHKEDNPNSKALTDEKLQKIQSAFFYEKEVQQAKTSGNIAAKTSDIKEELQRLKNIRNTLIHTAKIKLTELSELRNNPEKATEIINDLGVQGIRSAFQSMSRAEIKERWRGVLEAGFGIGSQEASIIEDKRARDILLQVTCSSKKCTDIFFRKVRRSHSGGLKAFVPKDVKGGKGIAAICLAIGEGNADLLANIIGKASESIHKFLSPEGGSLLHAAAKLESHDVINVLLNAGMDLDHRDNFGRTALHIAAQAGQGYVVKEFLKRGVDPNSYTESGKTALHFAAEHGDTLAVRELLKAGAHVCVPASVMQEPPLHIAAREGNVEALKEMLSTGIRPDIENYHSIGPLHYAARNGHLEAVKELLKSGANPDVFFEEASGVTLSCLQEAIMHGHSDIAVELINAGAFVDFFGKNRLAPAHFAANIGDVKTLKALIDNKADINAVDILDRSSVLQHAVQNQRTKCVGLLLSTDGIQLEHKNEYGDTALHIAVSKGYLAITEALLAVGADIDAKNQGNSLYQYIPTKGLMRGASTPRAKEILTKAWVKSVPTSRHNQTPLEMAIHAKHTEIVGVLLDRGADISLLSQEAKNEALGMLIKSEANNEQILKLIQGGASLAVSDEKGELLLNLLLDHASDTQLLASLVHHEIMKEGRVQEFMNHPGISEKSCKYLMEMPAFNLRGVELPESTLKKFESLGYGGEFPEETSISQDVHETPPPSEQ